jgi:hypothetical protein
LDRDPLTIDGEIGTVHPAKVAAAAFLRSHYVRGVITLRVESGGERQNLGRTKLHTKAASLTALHDN